MELYTSLVRLKQEMNGGALPPMTPIPESVKRILDPSFTIGLGAVAEEEGRGLRCPVRGCGAWFQDLGRHINKMHARLGGSPGVKRMLSIPAGAPLVSQALRARLREIHGDRIARIARAMPRAQRPPAPKGSQRLSGESRSTVGARNLRNSCVAQLTHRLLDLANEIGRSPTVREARGRVSPGFVRAVERTFGSWNAAKDVCGLEELQSRRRSTKPFVLESLSQWHRTHGTLPGVGDAMNPSRLPLLPSPNSIRKAMGTDSWPEAMRRAAAILNIYGGRYGLPDKKGAA